MVHGWCNDIVSSFRSTAQSIPGKSYTQQLGDDPRRPMLGELGELLSEVDGGSHGFLASGPAQAGRYSGARRSRSALAITDTELKVIAALAIIGLSNTPSTGYRMPAATGTPSVL